MPCHPHVCVHVQGARVLRIQENARTRTNEKDLPVISRYRSRETDSAVVNSIGRELASAIRARFFEIAWYDTNTREEVFSMDF